MHVECRPQEVDFSFGNVIKMSFGHRYVVPSDACLSQFNVNEPDH